MSNSVRTMTIEEVQKVLERKNHEIRLLTAHVVVLKSNLIEAEHEYDKLARDYDQLDDEFRELEFDGDDIDDGFQSPLIGYNPFWI